MDISTVWDYLVNGGFVTDETLQVITSINGYNIDTLNDVIYAVTGYNDFEQLQAEY